MDKFLYTIKLKEINKIKNKSQLISQMSIFTSVRGYRKQLNLRNSLGRLPKILGNTKENQIEAVYYYSLFTIARSRYIELGYSLSDLPNYATTSPLIIDVEATIAEIEQTHKLLT